jgi:hypothetical protein
MNHNVLLLFSIVHTVSSLELQIVKKFSILTPDEHLALVAPSVVEVLLDTLREFDVADTRSNMIGAAEVIPSFHFGMVFVK